jgi:hypothetical protein
MGHPFGESIDEAVKGGRFFGLHQFIVREAMFGTRTATGTIFTTMVLVHGFVSGVRVKNVITVQSPCKKPF